MEEEEGEEGGGVGGGGGRNQGKLANCYIQRGNLPLDQSQIATYSTNSLNYFEVSSTVWLFHRYCKLPQHW